MCAHALKRRSKREHPEQAGHDDHRIEAGPLPIAASQMKPHTELVEGEGEAEAVSHGAPPPFAVADLKEEEDSSDSREKKDAVIEVVDMGLAHMQKEIRNHVPHDEDHEESRGDERQQKDGEDDAGERANPRNGRGRGFGGRFRGRWIHACVGRKSLCGRPQRLFV